MQEVVIYIPPVEAFATGIRNLDQWNYPCSFLQKLLIAWFYGGSRTKM